METEVEELRDELRRLGIAAHVHEPGTEAASGACATEELCISEEDYTAAAVIDRMLGRTFHVDTMTAVEVLSQDTDGTGRERVLADLESIDLGE